MRLESVRYVELKPIARTYLVSYIGGFPRLPEILELTEYHASGSP